VENGRLVSICDWLRADFGAVSQYAMVSARELAQSGWAVMLVGLASGEPRREAVESFGEGALEFGYGRPSYEKQRLAERLVWTNLS
jgi:hypothetical protein